MSTEPIKKRRTIRKYMANKISDEQLRDLLLAAMYAPSTWGKRSWQFIVIDDGHLKEELGSLTPYSSQASQAAIDIIILADKSASNSWIEDTSIAAEHINLEAAKLGLGSSWVQIRGMMHGTMDAEEYLRDLLGIPDNFGICCMITVGQAAENKPPHREEEFAPEKVHLNRFGMHAKVA